MLAHYFLLKGIKRHRPLFIIKYFQEIAKQEMEKHWFINIGDSFKLMTTITVKSENLFVHVVFSDTYREKNKKYIV